MTCSNGFVGQYMTLTLGDDFAIAGWRRIRPNCRFVKVTPKGFNFIDLDTNRTILKSHLYMKGMSGKTFPSQGGIQGKFLVPAWLRLQRKPQQKENAS
jgi:hypothetical protein